MRHNLHFELTLTLPHDERFAPAVRDLAVHAAEHAGCARPRAEAFGEAAERLLRECLEHNPARGPLPVVVRRRDGPVELLIDARLITLEI